MSPGRAGRRLRGRRQADGSLCSWSGSIVCPGWASVNIGKTARTRLSRRRGCAIGMRSTAGGRRRWGCFLLTRRSAGSDGICVGDLSGGDPRAAAGGDPRPRARRGRAVHRLRALRGRVPARRLLDHRNARRLLPPVRPEWRLPPEQAEHFLRSRRSIRVYKEKQVDPGTLERLIQVARYAPSGHNRQPVRWLVISGREQVRALAGHVVEWMRHFAAEKPAFARRMMLGRIIASWEAGQDPVCRGAHHVIVTHAPEDRRDRAVGVHPRARLPGAGGAFLRARGLLGGLPAARGDDVAAAAGGARPAPGGRLLRRDARRRAEVPLRRLPVRRDPEITWR